MIRLLLIIIFILFFLWLALNLFSSKKNEIIKFRLNPKFIIILIIFVVLLLSIRFLPKLMAFFPNLQGLISPLIGILRGFYLFNCIYDNIQPPSISIVVPVMNSFSMANIIAFATSLAVPALLIILSLVEFL